MGKAWSPHSVRGALQASVVGLILEHDENLIRRVVDSLDDPRSTDFSDWRDLDPSVAVLCQICRVVLDKDNVVTVGELFRHLKWEDWNRLLFGLCKLWEVDPVDWRDV